MPLSQSASGYQSAVPLILTAEYLRQFGRLFIVEEPELNLYPTAQKELIYSLIGGLQPNVSYQDAEWVITTHSPYVLSSFNTLMLAYKVGNQSDELRAEVEKIIPSRCWINPDEFAAYYVDKGTVRSIVSEQTGMIADNELDDVSDDLADEQDKLFALRRSVTRA
nr:AAA family ATPase [Spirosoma rhododendri]